MNLQISYESHNCNILYVNRFRLYDVDGDGVASKSEVEHITKVKGKL